MGKAKTHQLVVRLGQPLLLALNHAKVERQGVDLKMSTF